MSSDSSDDEVIILYYYNRYRRRRHRRCWVNPYIEKNMNSRQFVAGKELQQSDAKFHAFYRMSKESYLHLVRIVGPAIQKKNTKMRESLSAEERILITLRYLITGDTFGALSMHYARGESTISRIVGETVKIFCVMLKDTYMPTPNMEEWKRIAKRFYSLWDVPNCLGAIDAKHIRIEKLQNSGTSKFNSAILMACCDADGLFTLIETGSAGRNCDRGQFRISAIKHLNETLDIPAPSRFPGDEGNIEFPYYFVGDELFPVTRYLMRPYPKRTLDNKKRILNYRLSRARKTIECTYGIMLERYQVLNGPIRCRDPEKIYDVIRSACILHNYISKREGAKYTPNEEIPDNPVRVCNSVSPDADFTINAQSSAFVLREYLSNYFVTPGASLPWQWDYCVM